MVDMQKKTSSSGQVPSSDMVSELGRSCTVQSGGFEGWPSQIRGKGRGRVQLGYDDGRDVIGLRNATESLLVEPRGRDVPMSEELTSIDLVACKM